MAHPYWPLFDLEIRTPRITVRYLDDATAVDLAALAAEGIHEPDTMPFAYPWTDAPSPELERNALRFYWRTRADTSPESWNIQLAVFDGDALVGTTNPLAHGFPATRTFETGSWLGRRYQGLGLGTELRIATLHLGFLALDAEYATTRAFADNLASLGVTSKLGYEPNGTQLEERRGSASETRSFRMSRRHFLDTVARTDIEIAGGEGVRELLGIRRAG
jgi:RimJ/RimL family protein N-acetyltransferase